MNYRIVVPVILTLVACGQADLQSNVPAAASLEIEPTPIFQFPTQVVGQTVEQEFTITNQGTLAATDMESGFYLSITFRYLGGYPGTNGTCEHALEPGESCTLVVAFSPQYSGDFEQTLTVNYFDGTTSKTTAFPILRGRGL